MKLSHLPLPTHLSYCTNVHAGESWPEAFAQLQRHLPAIKAQVARTRPFGIGLRLSEASLSALESPAALAQFQSFLQAGNFYLYTINGFPYGTFHGEAVKEQVYHPDWADPARRDYTNRLATLLTRFDLPEDHATISTLPGTYKDWAGGALPAITRHLLDSVAHCVALERETGKHIAIALEPEPCCLLETVDEVVDFFTHWLRSDAAVSYLCRRIHTSRHNALHAIHRHLGVCYDVCHSAVEFEDPNRAIDALQSADIRILKLQLSSALRLEQVDEESLAHLQCFSEPVYLHQVVAATDHGLQRYSDLDAAFAAWELRADAGMAMGNLALDTRGSMPLDEWRIHFHVPVFLATLDHFSTTQQALADVLERQRLQPFCRHLEVETYTWGVLPDSLQESDIATAIARELDWVVARL